MRTPEELVKFAVHEIVTEINTGTPPQEAATKVAKSLELNHNFIKRSCEAINVALHYDHFKKHPDSKADDFPIVDAAKVAEDIYSGKEKTASELESELFSSFQIQETAPKFARYLEPGPYKEAYAKLILTEDVGKNELSKSGAYDKSVKYISKLQKQAYDAEADRLDAEFEVNKNFCNILRKFAESNDCRSAWHEFETSVFSKYGNASNGYLDLLYKTSNLKEERGVHDSNIKLAALCNETELYDKFINSVTYLKEATVKSEDAAYNLNFEQSYFKGLFKQDIEKIADTDSLLAQVDASIKAERSKIAKADPEDPVMTCIAEKKAAVEEEFDSRIKSAIDLMNITKSFSGYKDKQGKPELSASTNTPEANRDRALLLQELVATDPIISKFPTHHVVDAYQQMLRIAPELSSEKEITRAFLRQAGASQAISPFEAADLIKANTGLFKQHQLQRGLN